jgi:NRAMP (natural resistance-associated macrophage protein)-like metal ion transporter
LREYVWALEVELMTSKLEVRKGTPTIPHEEPVGDTVAAIEKEKNPIKRIFKILGPGLITGASDDDPSGIATFAMVGASLGYRMLWMSLFTFPLMSAVQFICAKVGLVSGKGIAGVLRDHYPRKLMYVVVLGLVIVNTINAGVDIGAIGAAINILVPVPITVAVIPVALIILGLQIFGSYKLITKVFKWLTLALFAYIGAAFFSKPDWSTVLRNTIIPNISFDPVYISAFVALMGTSISPYLFFWQATQEVEEEISMGRKRLWQRKGASNTELKYAAIDVNIGMFVSQLVMYFIILTTASTLFTAGKKDVQSAADVAQALRPLAGDAAGLLLAVGLIGAGLLAVPVLTGSAAYAVAEAFGWKYGFDKKWGQARQFYLVISGLTILGALINFLGINPIQALYWTAVLGGFLAPPLLLILMLISNNKKIMGERVNGKLVNVLGWITTFVMFAAAILLVITSRG